MVTTATTRALVVVFCPAPLGEAVLQRALTVTRERVGVGAAD
jgi:hypothetical protein